MGPSDLELFPASFEASRERLLGWVPRLTERWPATTWQDVAVGPSGEPMTLVKAQAASDAPGHLLILVAGLHGVEGYAGSAVTELFLQEFMTQVDASTHSVWLIHAPNPTGWRERRKANHDNIDLNRSFVTRQGPGGEQALPSNPHHDDPALRALLEPPRPQPLLPQVARILLAAVRGQTAALTQALTMGQYTSPQGLYFGGTKEPVATTSLKQTFEKALTSAASVTVLDLHTGYGPRNTLAVVNSRYEPVSPGDWARRLSWPLVQSADGDSFYAIHGDMTDWLTLRQQQLAPQKPFWATTLEFGTWGDGLGAQIRTLRASVNENAAYWRGTPAQKRRWSAALADLYAPRSLRWRRAVVSQARELLPRVLSLHPRLASGLPAT